MRLTNLQQLAVALKRSATDTLPLHPAGSNARQIHARQCTRITNIAQIAAIWEKEAKDKRMLMFKIDNEELLSDKRTRKHRAAAVRLRAPKQQSE